MRMGSQQASSMMRISPFFAKAGMTDETAEEPSEYDIAS
jgi:hypothetical protein